MITSNPAALSEFNRSLVTRYKMGLGRIGTLYEQLAQVETSSTSQTIYNFLDAIGGLREWIGNRVVEDFSAYDFAIKNREFEKTMRVKVKDLEDDQYGSYGNVAEQLGDAARRHPDKLLTALIEGGFVSTGFDGVAFFATTHPSPSGGANQSNKGTTALSVASYAAARAQMQALTDAGGEILDIGNDFVLMVPPGLEEVALQILKDNPVFVGGVPQNNHWTGSARLIVNKNLTDANNWYLFDMGQIIKPFIMQFRKRPQLTSMTAPNSENYFRRGELLWGVDYRGDAGYALWQLAFGAAVA